MLRLNLMDQLPTSYLNICALYSALGMHKEAVKHGILALQASPPLHHSSPVSVRYAHHIASTPVICVPHAHHIYSTCVPHVHHNVRTRWWDGAPRDA